EVDEWVGLEIAYDLPASPMRKASLAGTIPDPDPLLATTPPGEVTIRPVRILPPSVLGRAAGMSREEIASELNEYGYRTLDEEALLRAATQGDADVTQLLLAAGIAPDARIGDATPLLHAVSFAGEDVILLLIRAGADVNVREDNGATPLIRLSNRCSQDDVTAAARALIEAGADVNAKAAGGGTALMMADVLSCAELAAMLRTAGAKEWK
ncbi:MAG TPA: ankyrin repeat domain-containing protein, partial [Thermoanaerobaculia bacterium]|nr:ankyrin repeat domain-containing protein [Thermoanaerobaculia bacterium]